MNRKLALAAACGIVAGLCLAGCATYATFGGFSSLLNDPDALSLALSITFQPPGSGIDVYDFLVNSSPSSIKSITRAAMSGGCNAQTPGCTQTFTGNQITSPLVDASVSTSVLYEYTLTETNNSTKSRWVEPVDLPSQQVTLTGPGESAVDYYSGKPAPVIPGSNVQLAWQDMTNKDPSLEYGYYVLVGTMDASSSSGIKAAYSAFLDESSHSVGVQLGTTSDLRGFTGAVLNALSSISQFSTFAPVSTSTLAPGTYVWTALPVVMNASRDVTPGDPNSPVLPGETSFGLGKLPTFGPAAAQQYWVFKVQ